jgi:uncharacterized repeat protein (TIGR03847 family)
VASSFDLPDVDRFTTGTVGPAGARIFYLQARSGPELVTLRLEKTQVAALADYLAERLADLPATPGGLLETDLELEEPVEPAWIVGSLGVSYEPETDRMLIVAEELQELTPEESVDPLGPAPAQARFGLTRAQVLAFVDRAAEVVASGRPPCPMCGRPLDDDHRCVKANGHRPR